MSWEDTDWWEVGCRLKDMSYMDIPVSSELLRENVNSIKIMEHRRVPPYQLPADSFLEEAVREIMQKTIAAERVRVGMAS